MHELRIGEEQIMLTDSNASPDRRDGGDAERVTYKQKERSI